MIIVMINKNLGRGEVYHSINIREKNKIIDCIVILSSLLYIIDVLLISKIEQSLNLRIQDIASVLSIISITYIIRKYKKNFSYIFLSILIFFTYVIIDNLIFYLNGKINGKFIFYIGKEVEYILCMFTILYFLSNYYRSFYSILNILICANILFGFYQVVIQKISYYGIGTIFETAPSFSGAIYFLCSILCFFIYKKYKKDKFKIYSLLFYILVLFTVSKTNILGLTIFYILYFIIDIFYRINKNLKNKNLNNHLIRFRKIFSVIIFLVIIIIFIIFILNSKIINNILNSELVRRIFYRFSVLNNSYSIRKNKAKYYYNCFIGNSVLSLLFGCGKGVTEFRFGTDTLAVDNQFIRGIIELGLIGIILWLNVIFSIMNFIRKSKLRINYFFIISLFISYLFMGIGYEVFVVTKSGIIFWFLTGIFIGDVYLNKNLSK